MTSMEDSCVITHDINLFILSDQNNQCGKTALAKQLHSGSYTKEHNVECVNHLACTWTHDDFGVIPEGQQLNVNIFDLNSGSAYQVMHNMWFQTIPPGKIPSALWILPYHAAEPMDYETNFNLSSNMKTTIIKFSSIANNVPILLVGTKTDLPCKNSIFIEALREMFPQIINTEKIEVSSRNGTNIQQLKNIIADFAIRTGEFTHSVPRSFLMLKQKITDWTKTRIASGELPICRKREVMNYIKEIGFFDCTVLKDAFKYFEKIGLFRYCYDNNTVVLDGVWLVKAFFRLIDYTKLFSSTSPRVTMTNVLDHDSESLQYFWPDENGFNETMRLQLTNLMHKYSITAKIPDADASFVLRFARNKSSWDKSRINAELTKNPDCVGFSYTFPSESIAEFLWEVITLKCVKFVEHSQCQNLYTCFRFGDTNGHLYVDYVTIYFIADNKSAVALRSHVYKLMISLLKKYYPYMIINLQNLYIPCYVCNNWDTQLAGRPLRLAQKDFYCLCAQCDEDIKLNCNGIADVVDPSNPLPILDTDSVDEPYDDIFS